jgi:transposase, IS5 family
MSELLSAEALSAFLQVIMIDLVLAGDNAVVIGLAAAGLPTEQRNRAILVGIIAATVLRVVFAGLTTQLLEIVGLPLALARRVKDQRQRERGRKVYSLHAPEVECIGKGKAHKPYEFGVKVSVATPLRRCRGGQFVAHVKALPGNPYDGHTLASVIPQIETTVGTDLARIVTDAGYKGHHAPQESRFRVYVAGRKRGLSAAIKRAFRRRAAVEPVIGHLKSEHRMGRNHLAHGTGDAINAVLAAVGYNFRLLIRWLAVLCALTIAGLLTTESRSSQPQPANR